MFRRLAIGAAFLTFVVVVVGSYVRLQEAGLGCPDWPGCYGHLLGVPEHAHEVDRATEAFPGRPVETAKAWKEMFHRYIAGMLGLLLLAVTIVAWRRRRSRVLATTIVALLGLQALLGMLTVTLLLKPVIVTLHLLGGMSTLALLTWLALREMSMPMRVASARNLRLWAAGGLLVVICQIALGGWVSTNYAALACLDLPTCHGAWLPAMDFKHAFQFARELGMTAAGAPLSLDALTAIQWTHRVGALIVFCYVGALAVALARLPDWRGMALTLALVLSLQIGLGVANVLLTLPLPVAVAHNAGAAALLVTMVVINFALSRGLSRPE